MECSSLIVVASSLSKAVTVADGQNDAWPGRGGKYRELYSLPVFPDFKVATDEGSLYVGTNAAFGTGVAGPNAAAFSATSALFSILNKAGLGGVRTYLSYIRLILTAIPTAGVSFDVGVTTDAVVRGSAGTAVAMSNPNQDSPTNSSISTILYNPTVAAASGAVRQISRVKVKGATPVAGDEYLLLFGSVEMAGALIASATVAGRYVIPMPQVIVGPGNNQSALIHLWSTTSSAAPSFEFEVGVIER